MTEKNALVPFKINALPVVDASQIESLEEVAKGAEFLPRIQLVTKGKYVDTGKIKPGHWGIPQTGGEEIEDLGVTIDVIPLCYRPKALDVADKDAVITVYDTSDAEFERIKNAPKNSGCMWGPSFLILERSTGTLYELFFGNKSGRMEAGKMKAFLPTKANAGQPMPASLGIRYIKPTAKRDYGWHVPVITKCSMPFDPEAMKVKPAQIEKEIDLFLNPPAEEKTEKVNEDEAKGQGRAR
jgi:hypothetical protein